MVARAGWLARAQRFFRDPHEVVPRLEVITDQGRRRKLDPLFDEQLEFLTEFARPRTDGQPKRILILKCRQIGLSTISQAAMFWKGYTAPPSRPRRILTVAHELGATKRMIRMTRNFAKRLPPTLRPGLPVDNAGSLQLKHNGSAWDSLLAGGRGQGRSETYTDLIFTEMAFYPQGSASVAGGDTAADRDVWASVNATRHADDGHIIVESTANGPRGMYYDLCKTAQSSDDWDFLFFPWHHQKRYRRQVLDYGAFERTLTDEEIGLIEDYALTFEQLAWRRAKLEEVGSIVRFRREYPLTPIEPFLLGDGGWFNQEVLNTAAGLIPPSPRSKDVWRAWEPFDPRYRYTIGMDTSGGVGRDYAVICIMREDGRQVARWRSNRTSPTEQAHILHRIWAAWGKPWALVEANNFGLQVCERAERLGVRLCKTPQLKFWSSTGGRAGDSKREAYTYARTEVNAGRVEFRDLITVQQAQTIVERSTGQLMPPSNDEHDDDIDAAVLALYARKWLSGSHTRADAVTEAQRRIRRMRGAA